MKYTIDGLDGSFEAVLNDDDDGNNNNSGAASRGAKGDYSIRINGADHTMRILCMNSDGIEFMLNGTYHKARYVSGSTRNLTVLLDGTIVTLGMHADLDDIVYKNSGGADAAGARGGGSGGPVLKSQIPGKVVSVAVSEGDDVKKGDVVCTLESMKMQVAVKSHRDGTVKSIKVRESATVAKGDNIAEIE